MSRDAVDPPAGKPDREPDTAATGAAPESAPGAAAEETVFGGGPARSGFQGMDVNPTAATSRSGARADQPVSIGPLFLPDELLADRYRVLRFLARGGMSEVYAVHDLELGEHIALKTLGPHTTDAISQARFKREISLARKIAHPNVCRIFDFGHHYSTRIGEVSFLTMELLEGETLSARIRREGSLTPAAALPLVRQMAAGLDAAHAAGVIHRDFKSSNVFLVPGQSGSAAASEPRVVVTDFGVARRLDVDPEIEAVTVAGQIIGTPAYMAPEQVQGLEVTPAADIYSLGVVLYQMVTGQLPFRGSSPFTTAVKRLTERPEAPRALAPTLGATWQEAILRCLEREPAARFRSAAEVVAALEGARVERFGAARGRSAADPAGRRGRRWWWAGGAALVAVLLALGLASGWGRRTAAPTAGLPAAPGELRRSIAVLGFKNLSGDPDAAWLANALAEMIGAELAAGGRLRLVPGESIARLKDDLELAAAETLSAETLQRVRRHSGADAVIVGSSLAQGASGDRRIRLDLRVQDTATGDTAEPVVVSGTESALPALAAESGALLRQRLGAGALTATEESAVRAALPAASAVRLYTEGVEKLRRNDALGARADLEQAIAAQPNYPLAHSALAAVWAALGYDARAAESARRGFEHAGELPLAERLWIEGQHYQTAREWDRAIETYRTLWSRFPDQLEYGLQLAATQTGAGRGADALATIDQLRALPPPARDDPRLDLGQAAAADAISDFRQAQESAARAAEKGARSEQRLLVADARLKESWALRNLGDNERGTAAAAEARRLYAAAGQRAGEALAVSQQAVLRRDRGDVEGARLLDEESLQVFREVGDQRRVTWALNNIAKGLELRGQLEAARVRFEEALALAQEIGDRGGTARQLNNLAGLLDALGDLPRARRSYEEALGICREISDRRVCADVLRGRGDSLLASGELAAAGRDYQESLALAREIGHRRYEGYAVAGLGDVALASGDLPAARRHHEEALALREKLGERVTAAASRLGLGATAFAEGRHAEAARLARLAAGEFATEKLSDHEARSLALLARALLAEGQPAARAEAESAAARAAALAERSENPRVRIQVALAQAAVEKTASASRAHLERAQALAAQHGLAGLRLETAIAAARLAIQSGDATAQKRLEELQGEARALGYKHLANQGAKA